VRQYTKYSRLRPKERRNGWVYSILAFAAVGILVWLWWHQRDKSRLSSKIQQTNAPGQRAQLSQTRRTSANLPPITVLRTNALAAQLGTNVPQVRIARMSRSHQSSAEQQMVDPFDDGIAETNAPSALVASPQSWRGILDIQVALARHGISPGPLDGKLGSQTRAALRAFQRRERIALSGEADARTKALLSLMEPLFTTYVVTSNDLARLTPLGQTWLAKSQQERLDYETILELVAEKGHAHPGLIRSLNRDIDWTNVVAGTVMTIPNVRYPPAQTKAAFIRIRLAEKMLEAFDISSNLLVHFPCSIAKRVEKRPLGQLEVERIAVNPNYRFDPEVFPDSAEGRELGRVLIIPPGPNNPVGTAWIGLNRPGYGIHGTARPEEVGRTESSGCFRLANWNAEYLLQFVSVGTPVFVAP